MAFAPFSLLRQWRSSLRADSPPPPLIRPSSLLSPDQPSYADELEPQGSEPSTPLPHEDFSYNSTDSAIRIEPFDPTTAAYTLAAATLDAPPPHTSASILLTPVSALSRTERANTVPVGTPSTPGDGAASSNVHGSPTPCTPLALSDTSFSSSTSFSSTPSRPAAALHRAASLSPDSTFSSLPSHAPSLPSLPPPPPPPARPPRLRPPALQSSLLLAYCRAWLLANEEYEVRARLNDTASDKHALKVRVHQRMQRMSGEEKRIAVLLEGLCSQEEQLRRDLDSVTSLMQQRQREGGHRPRKALHTQPSPSPSPRTPSTANSSLNALREQKHLLCSSIEQLIHKRNSHRQQLAVLQSSITCMTQALYQTHIALRERYTQFGEHTQPDDHHSPAQRTDVDILAIQETPRKPTTASAEIESSPGSRISLRRNPRSLAASVVVSPQAPSSPRNEQQVQQSGVRFVSNVDEWVLSSVGRLRELRETEGRLDKRLTKLIASRGQLASYFDRIQQFTRRQQQEQQQPPHSTRTTSDDKPTPADTDTSTLASLVRGWSLRTLATSQEADGERARQRLSRKRAAANNHGARPRATESIQDIAALQ